MFSVLNETYFNPLFVVQVIVIVIETARELIENYETELLLGGDMFIKSDL